MRPLATLLAAGSTTAVSVIMATRNKVSYLELTLASLERQTLPKDSWEIVVVDDSSNDRTPEILKEFELRGRMDLKYLRTPQSIPRGRAGARNDALRLAQGRILIFLDDDRLVRPDFLVQHLTQHLQGEKVVLGDIHRRIHTHISPTLNPELWHLAQLFLSTKDIKSAEKAGIRRIVQQDDLEHWDRTRPLIFSSGSNHAPIFAYFLQRGIHHPYMWSLFTTGNASVLRESVLKLGGFDENYVGWGLEDTDLAYRLSAAGIPFHFAARAYTLHQFHERGTHHKAEHQHNLHYFFNKHKEIDRSDIEPVLRAKESLITAYERSLSGKPADACAPEHKLTDIPVKTECDQAQIQVPPDLYQDTVDAVNTESLERDTARCGNTIADGVCFNNGHRSQQIFSYRWTMPGGKENFGDFLSKIIIEALGYQVTETEAVQNRICVFSIGTIISEKHYRKSGAGKIVIWGSGAGYGSIEPYLHNHWAGHLSFRAVRGPLTRQFLCLPRDIPLGDPALLLPRIGIPLPSATSTYEVLWVPHWANHIPNDAPHGAEGMQTMLLAPADIPLAIARIASARFILAESLHAAILAHAYGVPWAPAGATHNQSEPINYFKWADWFGYLEIAEPVQFARDYLEATNWWNRIGRHAKKTGVDELLRSFPADAAY